MILCDPCRKQKSEIIASEEKKPVVLQATSLSPFIQALLLRVDGVTYAWQRCHRGGVRCASIAHTHTCGSTHNARVHLCSS